MSTDVTYIRSEDLLDDSVPKRVARKLGLSRRRQLSGLGIALSGLPGLSLAPAIGMGIGAMCCAMLRLPLTSVLLATLLLGSDGLQNTPEVIVAVVVSFVVTTLLPTPGPAQPTEPAEPASPPTP